MVNPQGCEEACNPSQATDIIKDERSDFARLSRPGREHHAAHEPGQKEKEQVLRQSHQAEKKLRAYIGWIYLCQNPHERRLHSSWKVEPKLRRLDPDAGVVERRAVNLNHLGTTTFGPRAVAEEVNTEGFHHS